MRRYHTASSNQKRTIIVKYAGKCACCGAIISPGEMADYHPATKELAHIGGLDGNSARCTANIRATMYPDPGELAQDRWNEQYS